MGYFWEDVQFFGLLVLGTALFVVGLFGGVGFAVERMNLPGALANIEQLRADAANVDATESEDVIGQVVVVNQNIKSKQAYNKTWWAGPLIPDAWDDVELIQLPAR